MTAAIPYPKGDMMPQFTMQELKWIDQALRRDIDNSKELLSACPHPPQYVALVELDIANKETLRAKVNLTLERAIRRAAHHR